MCIPTRTCVHARTQCIYNRCTCSHKIKYPFIFAKQSMQERTVAISEACNQMPWLAEQDEEEEVTKEKLESKAEKINAGEPDAKSAPVAANEAPEAETKKEAPKPDGS